MSWITDLLMQGSQWLRPYSGEMAVAFVATLLVIYGDAINRTVRIFVKPYPLLLRITAFVALCTIGYGTLTVWGSGQVKDAMQMVPDMFFAPLMLCAFVLLGFLAERFHKS